MKVASLAFMLCLFAAAPAFGATGVVVSAPASCNGFYVVESRRGFAILQWLGGTSPSRGDTVEGDFETAGTRIILVRGRESRTWIDEYALSRSRAVEKITERCQ